jgi:peptidoglycan/LPS O-acetylase OafA/YrhL
VLDVPEGGICGERIVEAARLSISWNEAATGLAGCRHLITWEYQERLEFMNLSPAPSSPETASSSRQDQPSVRNAGRRRLVHVRELDGVRGLAAIAVFFHHVCFTSVPAEGWNAGVRMLSNVSQYGATGVDLFFALSGFLITSLLIEDRESPHYYRNFYWKRALRILPLYIACMLGVLAFLPGSGHYVLIAALFIANFASVFHLDASGPFWTLAIEEQFYLLWPTVVRHRSIAIIGRCAVVVGLSAFVLRLIAAYFGHHNYQFTFFHCDGLAMGAWLACRFEGGSRLGFGSGKEKIAWVTGLISAVVLVAVSRRLYGTPRGDAFGAACLQTAITLFAGALIAFVLVNRGRPLLKIFRSRILTFFGLISYAMYMVHIYVMWGYDHLRGLVPTGDMTVYTLRFFTILGITIVLALLSRYLLELPASSLRKYVLVPRAIEGASEGPANA